MAKSKSDLEKLHLQKIKEEKEQYTTWHSELIKRGVALQVIENKISQELQEFEHAIFSPIWYEYTEAPSDPFMAKFLSELDELRIFKTPNPIKTLFSKRKEIDENTRRMKFWSENDFINLSDEELIGHIAKYEYRKLVLAAHQSENTFLKWQENYSEELKSIIYPDKISEFKFIEKELFTMKYISLVGKWIGQKNYLVGFIIKLLANGFLTKRSSGKRIDETDYRLFFEKRYSTNISKEFQENRRNKLNEIHMKPFKFIGNKDI